MFQDLRRTLESPSNVDAPAAIVSMDGTKTLKGLKCGAQCCSEACAWQVLARITAFYTPLISYDHHPRDVERRLEHLSVPSEVPLYGGWQTQASLRCRVYKWLFSQLLISPWTPWRHMVWGRGLKEDFRAVLEHCMYCWCAGLDWLLCMCVYSCGQQMLWTVRARGGHRGQEHCFDRRGRWRSCWFACRFIFSASPPLLRPPPWAFLHHIPFLSL